MSTTYTIVLTLELEEHSLDTATDHVVDMMHDVECMDGVVKCSLELCQEKGESHVAT